MALLDSVLAFALTLAALATVATAILEIAFRFLRLKRIGQLRMVEKMIAHAEALCDGSSQPPAGGQESRIELLLANPFAEGLGGFLKNLKTYWNKASAFYEDISLEHTLRRLVDVAGAKDTGASDAVEKIGDKLDELALKYDEYCGALAERYKQNAHRWSLIVGVVLALVINVDGFRMLEAFLQDPEQRDRVIAELQKEEDGAAKVPPAIPKDAQDLEDLQKKYDELRSQVSQIEGLNLPIGWSYFPWCLDPPGNGPRDLRCPAKGVVENPTMDGVKQPTSDKAPSVAPGGAENAANTNVGTDPAAPAPQPAEDPSQTAKEAGGPLSAYIAWIVNVVATGLLIGLGAPFWYDVARRLAAVRSAFGGEGTAEDRHRGDDGQQSPEARKQLIQRIVKNFLTFGVPAEKRPEGAQTP